jgi:hypothetical protein
MRTITHLRTAGAIALLAMGVRASAQTIGAYRYWFDDDPTTIATNAVSGGQNYALNASVDASALGKGYHLVTMQFQDNATVWSVPTTSEFYHSGGDITAYQYWFDDAGVPVTVNITPSVNSDISASLDASTLSLGHHRATIRARDAQGNWSVPTTSGFTRMGGQEVAWQYWFDDNVGTLVNNTAGNTDLLTVATQIDCNTLGAGGHTITLRSQDQLNGYSVPLTYSFDVTVGIAELPGVQRVLLMPNPAENELVLRIDAVNGQALSVDVLDAAGRVVITPSRAPFSGTTTCAIDVSTLATGSYHLRIAGPQGFRSFPFVKR